MITAFMASASSRAAPPTRPSGWAGPSSHNQVSRRLISLASVPRRGTGQPHQAGLSVTDDGEQIIQMRERPGVGRGLPVTTAVVGHHGQLRCQQPGPLRPSPPVRNALVGVFGADGFIVRPRPPDRARGHSDRSIFRDRWLRYGRCLRHPAPGQERDREDGQRVEAVQHTDDGCGVGGVGEEELHHDQTERDRRPAHAVADLGAERDREQGDRDTAGRRTRRSGAGSPRWYRRRRPGRCRCCSPGRRRRTRSATPVRRRTAPAGRRAPGMRFS